MYKLSALPRGDFNIEVSAPNFVRMAVHGIHLSETERSIPAVMLRVGATGCGGWLAPLYLRVLENEIGDAQINGSVLTKADRPVRSADIQLMCEGKRSCSESVTDSAGRYTFLLKPGSYSLRIRRSGYFDDEYWADVQMGFETFYSPIYLSPCRRGACQPSRKPVAHCE